MTKKSEIFLTTAQAAARLGITPCRVRVLIRSGRLPTVPTAGREWLIREKDLELVRIRKPGRPWRKPKRT